MRSIAFSLVFSFQNCVLERADPGNSVSSFLFRRSPGGMHLRRSAASSGYYKELAGG